MTGDKLETYSRVCEEISNMSGEQCNTGEKVKIGGLNTHIGIRFYNECDSKY